MLHRLRLHPGLLLVAAALSACTGVASGASDSAAVAVSRGHDSSAALIADSLARARQDSANRARPDYVVDSIFPVEEEIRRFQKETRDTASALAGGASSRGELVRRFVAALETRDTAALRALHVTRAEFAWLIFPSSPFTRAPHRTKPGYLWLQTVARSDRGLTRAMQRVGGRPLRIVGHRCEEPAEVQGANRVWSGCVVRRLEASGDTLSQRLFGAVVERDGRFKLLGFANDF